MKKMKLHWSLEEATTQQKSQCIVHVFMLHFYLYDFGVCLCQNLYISVGYHVYFYNVFGTCTLQIALPKGNRDVKASHTRKEQYMHIHLRRSELLHSRISFILVLIFHDCFCVIVLQRGQWLQAEIRQVQSQTPQRCEYLYGFFCYDENPSLH